MACMIHVILSLDRVTVEGVWVGDWLYCALQFGITSNYSTVANSHTLQFTAARTKPSQSLCLHW
jgi:hypothetical protein